MPPLKLYLYRFFADDSQLAGSMTITGHKLPTWRLENVEANQMDSSFEQAVDRLSDLPRLYIEPDGSFVWTGKMDAGAVQADSDWQLFGMLYDVGERLNRIELQGCCPLDRWQALCNCVQPDGRLVAYLLDYGCFVKSEDLHVLWS
jgi:hypothetical protein